jgi:hypothetical protein
MLRCLAVAGALALAGVATPVHAITTINVEIDWMTTAGHSHEPPDSVIQAAVAMFACRGITLNVVKSGAIPETFLLTDGLNPKDFFTATGPGTFQNLKAQYQNNTGAGWRYCIFGHRYQEDGGSTGSSGIAELPGDDFLVSLGAFQDSVGTQFERASTFVHEMGHTLGLTHAGSMNSTVVGNGVATFPSIMSYAYQLRGIRTHMRCLGLTHAWALFKEMDYSSGRMPAVNEGNLNESQGMGMNPVDWNCNGTVSGSTTQDLDTQNPEGRWCTSGGGLQLLTDRDEWAVILSLSEPNGVIAGPDQHESCITRQEFLSTMSASDCAGNQAPFAVESCLNGNMVFVDPAYGGTMTGTGSQPWNSIANAYVFSINNSVIHAKPGNYSLGTGILNKPLIIAAPAGANIGP